MFEYKGFEVYWEGHGSVKIVDEGFTVVVDPHSKVSDVEEADLVLITQPDEKHYDRDLVEKLCTDRTCVVAPKSMESYSVPCNDVEYIEENEVIDIFGIEIEAVPLENQESQGIGYRFVMRGTSFYVSGDIRSTESMHDLEGRVDICFLPVDGVNTMDLDGAVNAAVRIKPRVVVPYHYGEPFFSEKVDVNVLKAELEDRSIGCKLLRSHT